MELRLEGLMDTIGAVFACDPSVSKAEGRTAKGEVELRLSVDRLKRGDLIDRIV